MKIAIDKSILVSELDIVSKAAPSGKTVMPILEGVLLTAQDKHLHLSRNNLDVAIMRTTGCEVIEPGTVVVNAKLFTDIIRRMPDEEIDIWTSDKKMDIEANKTHMEIGIVSPAGFPGMPEVNAKTSFKIDQQTLKAMVSRVAFAVAVDETRPSLTGICITALDGMLDVVGINGYMMAWHKTAMDLGDLRILPKGCDLENICRLLDTGNVIVSSSENLVELATDKMRITLRALDGEYMNYKNLIPKEFKTTARIKNKEFQLALERSLLFRDASEGKLNSPMMMNITPNGFKLTIAGGNGTFDEDFTADVDGEKLKIGFDALKIYECLKRIEEKEIILKFSGSFGPCIIAPVQGDAYAYMVLPVRI